MRVLFRSQTALNHENLWKKLILAMVRITVVYSIVSISIIALSFRFVVPFFRENLPHFWASLLGAVFIILCIAPFLRAIMVKKNHSAEFMTLWHDSRANRAPLVSTIVIRIMIAALFVIFVISGLFKASIGLVIGVAVLVVLLMVWSRRLKKQSILIERRFFRIFVPEMYVRNIWERKSRNTPDVYCRMTCILRIWKFRENPTGRVRHCWN